MDECGREGVKEGDLTAAVAGRRDAATTETEWLRCFALEMVASELSLLEGERLRRIC